LSYAPIFTYSNWQKEFHVHIDAFGVALGVILVQLGEGNIKNSIYLSNRKLSHAKHNYTTIEREGFFMVHALQKFRHYLLGGHFKFFTDHSALKYLVNKLVLEGRILRWLFLFHNFSFEVIVKPGKLNVGPDHLSRLETGECGGPIDDQLPNAYLFHIEVIPDYLSDVSLFLTTGKFLEDYFATQKPHLFVRAMNYRLIVGQLYKMVLDSILRICILDHERYDIILQYHSGKPYF
jgi:hypothetical protein